MKVSELIKLLEKEDGESYVYFSYYDSGQNSEIDSIIKEDGNIVLMPID